MRVSDSGGRFFGIRRLGTAALTGGLIVGGMGLAASPAAAVDTSSVVVISEVYGAGGNGGASFTNDFIELYNNSDNAVDLSGWSVQYASATGTTWTNQTNLKGAIPARGFYLIQESGGTVGVALPTPAVTGTIAMAAGAGKVALVNSTNALGCGNTCSTTAGVVDFVGYGPTASDSAGGSPTAAPSATKSVSRTLSPFTNTGKNGADFTLTDPTPTNSSGAGSEPPPVDAGTKTIAEIQGTGDTSPLANQIVTTSGVVTAVYPTGGFNGYTIQTPGTGGAIDFTTHKASDGLFVFSPATVGSVAIGDYVQVSGKVTEFSGLTELTVSKAGDLTKLTTAHDPVTAATTSSWPATDAERETLESMLYRPTGNYTVADTYSTNQYGEVVLAYGTKPLIQPTEVAAPDSQQAAAVAADNAARAVTLDDGASTNFLSAANSGLTPPYISLTNPVRTTEKVTFTKDVIVDYRNAAWKFQPTAPYADKEVSGYPATFENNRAATPNAATIGNSDLKVASFNVQNFFTSLGDTWVPKCSSYSDRDGNPITVNTCPGVGPRGAWTQASLDRQTSKIVKAINAADVDVAGLMEVENSVVLGKAKDSALAYLVDRLNADAGTQKWAYVPSSTELPPASEMDVINSAIIYQPAKVSRVGESRALGTESTSTGAFGNAREPIGQVFVGKTTGAQPFLFVVNHFKSKGSAGPWPGDADTGNGVGASNESRVRQANALAAWVPTVLASTATPTKAVVMVGDYNAYGAEQPVQILKDAGYTEVEQHFDLGKYSYVFKTLSGSLDHVFVNADALSRTTGADIWNINSVESIALNYSRYNYHGTLFWDGSVPFAASDHDPVVVGLNNKPNPINLTLLNINDFHGRIDSNTVKFAGTVEKLRAAGGENNTVFLSAGDNIGASLFASASANDQPTIDVLNALDLKASAVGNHEFDKGYSDLVNRVIDNGANAKWKYLGANVYAKGTKNPVLPEYQILDVAGVKVGVIGAITQETPTLVSPAGIADLDFGDPVEAVNRVAAQLTDGDPSNGEADILVAEYHEGAGTGTPDGATLDQEVAAGGAFAEIVTKTSPKVAAIFTGHTHKQYAWDAAVPGESGKTRPILQTGSYGEFIGKIVLTFDPASGQVTAHTAENVARTTDSDASLVAAYPRVATVKQITDKALAAAAVIGNQKVGSVTADITTAYFGQGSGYTGPGNTWVAPTRDDRSKESTLGNLVANSLLETLSPADRGGAEIGVVNPGGLRSELLYGTDGTVTYAQANAVLPFVNNLWTTSLTGAQVKTMLEQQWQTNADGTIPSRPYLALGLSKNVTYTFDSSRPMGDRVTSITVNGVAIDPARSYRIGTFSFLATGGDNFRVFTAGTNAKDTGLIDRDAWIAYLQAHQGISPDFARHAVEVSGNPAEAEPGSQISFNVKDLNLTSLGSPANTSVVVKLGDTQVGIATVTDGAASVTATIPGSAPAGSAQLTIIAAPSGTTVTLPITIKQSKVATTTTVSASPATQVFGTSAVVLTAKVTAADGSAVNGTVEFLDGNTVLGTAAVANGSARFTLPATVTGGIHQVVAKFTGTAKLLDSQSAPVTVTVTKAASSISLTASAPQQKIGRESVVLTARVTSAAGTAGSVIFRDGDRVLGTAQVSGALAQFALPTDLPKGKVTLTAEFVPAQPGNIAGSVSNEVKVQVHP